MKYLQEVIDNLTPTFEGKKMKVYPCGCGSFNDGSKCECGPKCECGCNALKEGFKVGDKVKYSDVEDSVSAQHTRNHGKSGVITSLKAGNLAKVMFDGRQKNSTINLDQLKLNETIHPDGYNDKTGMMNGRPYNDPMRRGGTEQSAEDKLQYYKEKLKRLQSDPNAFKTHIKDAELMVRRYSKRAASPKDFLQKHGDILSPVMKRLKNK